MIFTIKLCLKNFFFLKLWERNKSHFFLFKGVMGISGWYGAMFESRTMEITAYLHSWLWMKDSWSCEDVLLVRGHPIAKLVSMLEAQCWRQAMDRVAYMPLSAAPSRNPRLLPIGLLFLSRLSHSLSFQPRCRHVTFPVVLTTCYINTELLCSHFRIL